MSYMNFSREIWLTLCKTCSFFNSFTVKFNNFSLYLTGDPDFLILFISTQNNLSMGGFK